MFQKLINDTLKSPDGKYSRKNLTTFVSFVIAVLLSFIVIIGNISFKIPIDNNAVIIIFGFLTMAGYQGSLALKDKINNRNNNNLEN
jgi:hypothetical protein